ncbi:MAG: tRNA 2-thiocytidine biosynthesis TtcA family protein [Clostridiales bacterium]|nr:tRNA 2-thiocytidine biosynthesis TtcA family protein [Clostridiales bacterium]
MQKLLSLTRKCDADFGLIESGDRIAVGLSGGKDSLALLYALSGYKRFCPNPFELCAVVIDAGAGCDFSTLVPVCEQLNVPLHIVETQIAPIVFEERKEKNPCSLCAKMRRGALDNKLNELGYNVLALGHNADDMVETFLLSMLYEGRLSTLQPKSYLDRSGIKLIRPLLYVREKETAAFVRENDIHVVHNPCPANGNTERETMKSLIADMCRVTPDAFERAHSALTHPERNNLIKPNKKD